MKLGTIIFIYLCILLSPSVFAITVAGLYQATVPVKDESVVARELALKQALMQVLIKLTGNRNINKTANIGTLTDKSARFLQQFRYRQTTNNKNSIIQSSPELWVQFDENVLNAALRDYGLSIWGKQRPSILVWLAYENNGNRQMVSLEEKPEYLEILDKRAFNRGLTLLLPLFDLEDTSRINVSDVWGGFKEPVFNASERYQADVILTVKLAQVLPILWEMQWTAHIDGEILTWDSRGELADIVLEEGIDELADRLAARYVNTDSTYAEVIELAVTDIRGIDSYARTLAYLESLQAVSTVKVKRVSDNEVLFELTSHGGLSAIEQVMSLGNILERVGNNEQPSYRFLSQ